MRRARSTTGVHGQGPLPLDLTVRFAERFGGRPSHAVRAPGRVNLIGEHIDYNGLSVLPMALPRAVRIVFRARADGEVRLLNADDRFGERSFRVSPATAPGPAGDWGNYVRAAAVALAGGFGATRGLDGVVASDIPVAAGLSSSSALVIACGLALATANDLALDTRTLGEAMARGERYVGTMGGGMDQAISLGAVEGCASRIDFDPLALTPVPVPPAWRFVVAHSLEPAEKSGPAQAAYNQRTRECAQALDRVREALGLDAVSTPGYRELLGRVSSSHLLAVAEAALAPLLRKRFRHVVTEADRVRAAEAALREDAPGTFGHLMDLSHDSLRDDYAVSSPALDRLVEAARRAGALGARLTGAGFGGCTVMLTDAGGLAPLMDALGRDVYEPAGLGREPGDHLFEAVPSAGASVVAL